jgi:hypothetical protein
MIAATALAIEGHTIWSRTLWNSTIQTTPREARWIVTGTAKGLEEKLRW